MTSTLGQAETDALLGELDAANQAFQKHYPGASSRRQPCHTVYGGAQLYKNGAGQKLGDLGRKSLEAYAPNFAVLAQALDWPQAQGLPTNQAELEALTEALEKNPEAVKATHREAWLAHTIYQRILDKLEKEPVEDFRIDFEDGYGNRPDEEEDGDAVRTAKEVARGMKEGGLTPFLGIRIKPFNAELTRRSVRTLDLFLSTLAEETGGKLPENFVVTLPKVQFETQVRTLVRLFEKLEAGTQLEAGSLKMEIMIETTQAILGSDGRSNLPPLVQAAEGRCTGAHFGTYDFTASASITAAHQVMAHPECMFALHMMKMAFAGTGIWLSDGATNVLPVGPHRAAKDGPPLTQEELKENERVVHGAWKTAYDHNMNSLRNGFYQGWDLHPAQLPIRYASVYRFFLSGLDQACLRLKTFMEKAAQATLVGDVFDDAATGQGLLNFFLQGLGCGAISEEEALSTGLTLEELQSRSFLKIVEGRR